MKKNIWTLLYIIEKLKRRKINMIKIGDLAPKFSFTNQDGKNVSLDDFSGTYVLMWWYPKADTPG
jgi:peroxiredoxin Q/BCP